MNWSDLRAEFPVVQKWAFFDHAGASALPRSSAAILREFAYDMMANGSTRVGDWVARATDARLAIAKLLNADPRGIALAKNTSEAISFVAEGYPWKSGDNVVLPADEYPSNQYPWMNLESRGVAVRRVLPRGNRVEIDDLRAACDSRTKVIAVSHVGFASGFHIDLGDVVTFAHQHDIHVMVDAIQSLGVMPLDVRQTPVDFVACGSHKWLLGPQGAGFLYMRPDLIEFLRPVEVGATSVVNWHGFTHIEFQLKPDATRWEGGTLNFGGFAAFANSIEFLNNLSGVTERIKYLTDQLCHRATAAGLKVFSSRTGDDWSGIVSIDLEGRDVAAVVKRCKDAGVVVNNRGGRLRACPHVYNNEDEIDRLMSVVTQAE